MYLNQWHEGYPEKGEVHSGSPPLYELQECPHLPVISTRESVRIVAI